MLNFKSLYYSAKSKFLDVFGDIKVFSHPLWIVYDPSDYDVSGQDLLDIYSLIKPGDVLQRGYNHYLDGWFIPDKHGYSHSGIYVGNNEVVHAVSPAVQKTHLFEFLACDRVRILRPKAGAKAAVKKALECLKKGIPYDFSFSKGASSIYCHELVPVCYPKARIKRMAASIFCGLIKKKTPVYLAQSILDSPDFCKVFESNRRENLKNA